MFAIFIFVDEVLHLFMESGCQIGIGAAPKVFDGLQELVASCHEFVARGSFAPGTGALFRIAGEIAAELEQQAFEAVVIARASGFGAIEGIDEAMRGEERAVEIVGLAPGSSAHLRELANSVEKAIDLRLAIEGRALPAAIVIAPLDQLP